MLKVAPPEPAVGVGLKATGDMNGMLPGVPPPFTAPKFGVLMEPNDPARNGLFLGVWSPPPNWKEGGTVGVAFGAPNAGVDCTAGIPALNTEFCCVAVLFAPNAKGLFAAFDVGLAAKANGFGAAVAAADDAVLFSPFSIWVPLAAAPKLKALLVVAALLPKAFVAVAPVPPPNVDPPKTLFVAAPPATLPAAPPNATLLAGCVVPNGVDVG